ncbi:uncharacterized protein [Panulirus ornatus]|uniref:uncharacterized protein n=1 Tax=Panulirus ornatus TaxID=150431 RepID=UPI003A84809D
MRMAQVCLTSHHCSNRVRELGRCESEDLDPSYSRVLIKETPERRHTQYRRTHSDKMYLGMLVTTVIATVLLQGTTAQPCCGQHHNHHHGAGAAIAGALVVAGAHAARHHNHHNHGGGGCYNCGCGGCGSSCGWCGGGYGRRKRRSLEGFLNDTKTHETYSKIAAEDKDQCGLRLVCELAQKDPRNLAEDEIQILTPYRGAGESDGTNYGDYDEAAWHGQEGHSCADNYPLCAFTATQVMDEYRKYSQEHPDDGEE